MEKADIQQHAKTIAKTLKERNKYAIHQIEDLIELMGIDFVQENMAEMQRIEVEGGMKTNDGTRRRTRGGVFFYIVKPKLSPEQRAIIFPPPDWKKRRAKKKAKAQATQLESVPNEEVPDEKVDAKPVKETPGQVKPEAPSSNVTPESDKLAKLETVAETLRERIAEMEAKGQKGIAMTRTLLKNTEKQIESLRL